MPRKKSRNYKVDTPRSRSASHYSDNMVIRKLRLENKQLRTQKQEKVNLIAALRLEINAMKKMNKKLKEDNQELLDTIEKILYDKDLFKIFENIEERNFNLKTIRK